MAAQGWAGEEEGAGGEFGLQWDVDRVNLDFKTGVNRPFPAHPLTAGHSHH
jgi:hypothetical protein